MARTRKGKNVLGQPLEVCCTDPDDIGDELTQSWLIAHCGLRNVGAEVVGKLETLRLRPSCQRRKCLLEEEAQGEQP